MSYRFLPTHKLLIETKKTPLEVLDCLKLHVDSVCFSVMETNFKKNKAYFVGEINGYNFKIRENRTRKAFIPLINGNIRESSEGSIVDISIGIHYWELIVSVLVIIFSLLSTAPLGFKLGVNFILIVGLFLYEIDRRDDIAFLKKILI